MSRRSVCSAANAVEENQLVDKRGPSIVLIVVGQEILTQWRIVSGRSSIVYR